MLKIISKLLIPVLLLSLMTACTMPFTKVKPPLEDEPLVETNVVPMPSDQDDGELEQVENVPLPEPILVDNLTPVAVPITDLWQRIREGFELSYPVMDAVTEKQLDWFVKHPEYVNKVADRAKPYLYYIVDELERRNMPLEIALLPIVESGFQPFAYSPGRAAGLWQFIPGTGKVYGLEQNWWYDGRRDVMRSTHAALDYLQKLHKYFGDWQLALAAYNCGEGTVGRAIKKNRKLGKGTDFWSLDLPKETSVYLPKLLAVSHLINEPGVYGLTLAPIDNIPFLTTVDVGSQIDLAIAAKLAGITADEMYLLNPGFSRWATAPDGPHSLVLPIDNADQFNYALSELPQAERVQWTRHEIKSGESLGLIAQKYKTTKTVIKQANGLSGSAIKAGHYLMIPTGGSQADGSPLRQVAQQAKSRRSGTKKIHKVKAGDTWWDIAIAYNVSVTKLTGWNKKTSKDILNLGQKLVIWTTGKTRSSNKTINYKIQQGDSLWIISRKYNVSVEQVREWNGLSERTLLRPGQNLTLHLDKNKKSSI